MIVNNLLFEIIWIVTELFFIFSIILLLLLTLARHISSYRVTHISKSVTTYQDDILYTDELPSQHREFVSFCYALGIRLSSSKTEIEKNTIKRYIKNKDILNRLYGMYNSSSLKTKKLYYLLLIVLLQGRKYKVLYRDILRKQDSSNKDNYTFEQIEFSILSLYGLALVCRSSDDLRELYYHLDDMDNQKFISQKLSQFFFNIATQSMREQNIILFIYGIGSHKIKSMTTLCAFIYSLRDYGTTEDMQIALLDLQERMSEEVSLLVAIIRVLYEWDSKPAMLVMRYFNHPNDIVRIVCSKIALDIVPLLSVHRLLVYLCDPNINVQKNFRESLAKHSVGVEYLTGMLDIYDDEMCKIKIMHEIKSINSKIVD